MSRRDDFTPVAEQIPFDNDTNGFISEDTQAAIEEVNTNVQTSASPGFSFGRASNVNSGSWLQCETVPSNKTGRFVYITNAFVRRVFVSSETIDTYDIEVYYNDKAGLYGPVGLVLMGSVSVVNDYGGFFVVNWAAPIGTELAIRLVNGSAKNVVAGLELSGSFV